MARVETVRQTLKAFEYVFPVIGGPIVRGDPRTGTTTMIRTRNVYGTAFCLAEGLFLTAAHVIRNASEQGDVWLGYPEGTTWKGKIPSVASLKKECRSPWLSGDSE